MAASLFTEAQECLFFTGNHSPHGHAASIWTEDLTLALETAKRYMKAIFNSVAAMDIVMVSAVL